MSRSEQERKGLGFVEHTGGKISGWGVPSNSTCFLRQQQKKKGKEEMKKASHRIVRRFKKIRRFSRVLGPRLLSAFGESIEKPR